MLPTDSLVIWAEDKRGKIRFIYHIQERVDGNARWSKNTISPNYCLNIVVFESKLNFLRYGSAFNGASQKQYRLGVGIVQKCRPLPQPIGDDLGDDAPY